MDVGRGVRIVRKGMGVTVPDVDLTVARVVEWDIIEALCNEEARVDVIDGAPRYEFILLGLWPGVE